MSNQPTKEQLSELVDQQAKTIEAQNKGQVALEGQVAELKTKLAEAEKAAKDSTTALTEELGATIKEQADVITALTDEVEALKAGKAEATDTPELPLLEAVTLAGSDKPSRRSVGGSLDPWVYRESISFEGDSAYALDSMRERAKNMAARAFTTDDGRPRVDRVGPLDQSGNPTFKDLPADYEKRVLHVAVWIS
jgi:hypothetical protein